MRGFLLDVNVLIALLWARHEHHVAALRWFAGASERGWATCSLTQLGFVRIVSNAAFSADAVRPSQAVAILETNLRHPTHATWEDRWGAVAVLEPFAGGLIGHRQVTDAYLLGLAIKHGGRLATFDGGIDTLAPPEGPYSHFLEHVPIAVDSI